MSDKIQLVFSLDVIQSSLGYIGTVKEIPVVVEAPTTEELKEDMRSAILVWLQENRAAAEKHLVVQIPA